MCPPPPQKNWECNMLQGTCEFGDTILLNAMFCRHDIVVVFLVASTKCSYVVVCIKSIKSHNSCKICRIKMAAGYDQLHMVANNHTKFQQNPCSGFWGVASTKCYYVVVCIKSIKSHNSCKICWSKMAAGYDQWNCTRCRAKYTPLAPTTQVETPTLDIGNPCLIYINFHHKGP